MRYRLLPHTTTNIWNVYCPWRDDMKFRPLCLCRFSKRHGRKFISYTGNIAPSSLVWLRTFRNRHFLWIFGNFRNLHLITAITPPDVDIDGGSFTRYNINVAMFIQVMNFSNMTDKYLGIFTAKAGVFRPAKFLSRWSVFLALYTSGESNVFDKMD